MGAMRLPTASGGPRGPIDEGKAVALVDRALENGVNYFDTAYMYHGGQSEPLLASALRRHPRGSWLIATKMPGHMMTCKDGKVEGAGYLAGVPIGSPEQIFEEQLRRCGVGFFDFYLLHNVCETAYDFYADEGVGVVEYLLAQKRAGRIRHLGFSAHGRADNIERFLSAFGGCMEFAQIQLNYFDWILQDAAGKYEAIARRGLPMIAMEPCRGGRLASLNAEADARLKAARPGDSVASWAFRFLQSLPGVSVALSGMTTHEQLMENVALFSRDDPTTELENALLREAADTLLDLTPCTACRYCCDACPQGLDIPKLLSMGDEIRFEDPFVMQFTLRAMAEGELPGACTACGECSRLCPQGIDVPAAMARFKSSLDEFNKKY
jgi:predicted aldo/keto reductase-like oxidoreductase